MGFILILNVWKLSITIIPIVITTTIIIFFVFHFSHHSHHLLLPSSVLWHIQIAVSTCVRRGSIIFSTTTNNTIQEQISYLISTETLLKQPCGLVNISFMTKFPHRPFTGSLQLITFIKANKIKKKDISCFAGNRLNIVIDIEGLVLTQVHRMTWVHVMGFHCQ